VELIKIPIKKINHQDILNDDGIQELSSSIKAVGLLQPIIVLENSENKQYDILSGTRRISAYNYLNDKFPNQGFDEILTIVKKGPWTIDDKKSFRFNEGTYRKPLSNLEMAKVVNDLFAIYYDYDMVQEKFGLTKYMVDKFVRLARLPPRLIDAINEGKIHPNDKTAENAAIRAVDALQWKKGGDVNVNDVLELAKEYATDKRDSGPYTVPHTSHKKYSILLNKKNSTYLEQIAEENGQRPEETICDLVERELKKNRIE
jgi:ParB/RepB/Spo0J family partition protein